MDYKKINENFYSKSQWGIDRSRNKWFSKYVKYRILNKFMKKVNRDVLYDAGGGVGNYGWYFRNDFKKVIVSDISKIALSQILEKDIKKINCSVLNNKLPSNSVDCILLMDVFEHIYKKDLPKMMGDLRRILKPNGRILMFTTHFGWGWGGITRRIFNPKKRLPNGSHKGGHVNLLSIKEFRELFKKENLKIENYYFYSVIFQQITDLIKNSFAKFGGIILRKQNIEMDIKMGSQLIKENLREREENALFKIPLWILSHISYLDILLFSKLPIGNAVFFSLKKENSIKL